MCNSFVHHGAAETMTNPITTVSVNETSLANSRLLFQVLVGRNERQLRIRYRSASGGSVFGAPGFISSFKMSGGLGGCRTALGRLELLLDDNERAPHLAVIACNITPASSA